MPYRQKKGKEKEKKSEKENEKKAERSTVKMYYWNVALSEHCEEVAATVPEVKEEPLSEPLSPLSEEDII